jgi:hypothetical protein
MRSLARGVGGCEAGQGASLASSLAVGCALALGSLTACGPSYEGLARGAEAGDRAALERLLDVAASDDLHGFTSERVLANRRPLLTEGQQAAAALTGAAPTLRGTLVELARSPSTPPLRAASALGALAASKTKVTRAELAGSPCFAPASPCFREVVWLAAATWTRAELGELVEQSLAARAGERFFSRLFDGLAGLELDARAAFASKALAVVGSTELELAPGAGLAELRKRLPLALDLGVVLRTLPSRPEPPLRPVLCHYVQLVVAWAPLQAGSSEVELSISHHREGLAIYHLDAKLEQGDCPARPDLDVGPLVTELHDNDTRAAAVRAAAKKAGVGAKPAPVAAP